jgi:hypothetical protein
VAPSSVKILPAKAKWNRVAFLLEKEPLTMLERLYVDNYRCLVNFARSFPGLRAGVAAFYSLAQILTK